MPSPRAFRSCTHLRGGYCSSVTRGENGVLVMIADPNTIYVRTVQWVQNDGVRRAHVRQCLLASMDWRSWHFGRRAQPVTDA